MLVELLCIKFYGEVSDQWTVNGAGGLDGYELLQLFRRSYMSGLRVSDAIATVRSRERAGRLPFGIGLGCLHESLPSPNAVIALNAVERSSRGNDPLTSSPAPDRSRASAAAWWYWVSHQHVPFDAARPSLDQRRLRSPVQRTNYRIRERKERRPASAGHAFGLADDEDPGP